MKKRLTMLKVVSKESRRVIFFSQNLVRTDLERIEEKGGERKTNKQGKMGWTQSAKDTHCIDIESKERSLWSQAFRVKSQKAGVSDGRLGGCGISGSGSRSSKIK